MNKTANLHFPKRLDVNIVDMSKTKERDLITAGYYSAHDARFESNPTSGFCGGEVGPTPVISLMRTGTAGRGTTTS